MKSSFPAVQQRLPTLLAGVVLFLLVAVWSAAILHQSDAPLDIDIVFSPPARLTPGETTEIAFYAFRRNQSAPVLGLKLEANLRFADRPVPVTSPLPASEKRSGLYTIKLPVPESLTDGSYELAIFKTGFLRRPLAVFPVQVGKNLSIVAVPPPLPIRAGDSYRFELAAMNPVTSHALPRIPIRCRITTPDGFRTTNRVVFTTHQGTGHFSFSLHPRSPAGEYLFEFSCGLRSIVFRLPVSPALSPIESVRKGLLQLIDDLPTPLSMLISGGKSKPDTSEKWNLRHGKQPRSSIRWARAAGNVVRANFAIAGRRFGVIELWQRNRLLHSAVCTSASGTVEIRFRNKLPLNAPIKVRLWQKNLRQIWSDEYVIPSLSGSEEASRLFEKMAAGCAPAPGRVLGQLLSPPAGAVQIGGSLHRADRLVFLTDFFAEAWLLCLPWLLLTGLSLPLFGKLCSDRGNANCRSIATFLVPVSAAMTGFFLLILRTELTALPGILLLFTLFLLVDPLMRTVPARTTRESDCRHQTSTASEGEQALRTFIYLGQLLSGVLLIHAVAGSLLAQASQKQILLIITGTAALITVIVLKRIGMISLNRSENIVLTPVSATMQAITSSLSKGGWKAAVVFTVFLTALFIGILRLHSFISPPVSSSFNEQNRHARGQKNAQAHHASILQFSLSEPPRAPSGSSADGFEMQPSDSQRFVSSRFLILNGTRTWTGRRIQKILVFTKAREFLDRWIESLTALRPTLWTICLEISARSARFRLLEPSARPMEQERLEACLTVFGNTLARELQSGKTHSPMQHSLLFDTLENLSRAVSTDPAFKQAVQALPVVPATSEDFEPSAGLLEHATATAPFNLSAAIAPTLRTGGTVRLGNDDGVWLSFPIRQSMTPLSRGTSFRETFDIRRLESAREAPLLIELSFTP